MFAKILRYLAALAAGAVLACGKGNAAHDSEGIVSEIRIDGYRTLFAFPLLDLEAMGKEYFVSTLHGLKIERIVVDGVTLPPPEKRIYVDEGLREVIRCGGTVQIYQVVHGDQLVFAEHLGPDADTTVYRGYEIIENYRSLSITYRIRYPDMSLGPLSTLRVLRGKPPLPARK